MSGAAIGMVVAVLGAVFEYRLYLRRADAPQRPHTSLLHLIGGVLCFLGLVAVVVSLLLTSSIAPAVVMGIGVGIGFYGGFVVLLLVWLLRGGLVQATEEPTHPGARTSGPPRVLRDS